MKKQKMSLPLWECGLKFNCYTNREVPGIVTPLVGVWIEIVIAINLYTFFLSLPLWECGLKCIYISENSVSFFVTPLVGVWIEIVTGIHPVSSCFGHSPCGSVD